jgi:uncharacterized phiE125 gp8 family phage protein
MHDLIRTVAPAETPVSLDEARAHLRVHTRVEDPIIEALIAATCDLLDGYAGQLGRCMVTQTWQLHLPAFPRGRIKLPFPPVQGVDSITYSDAAGVTQTLSTSDYWTHGGPAPEIELVDGRSWPSTAQHRRAVTIAFTAGYGTAAAVPAPIKAAILLMVGDLYANREGGGVNAAVEWLISPFRIRRV